MISYLSICIKSQSIVQTNHDTKFARIFVLLSFFSVFSLLQHNLPNTTPPTRYNLKWDYNESVQRNRNETTTISQRLVCFWSVFLFVPYFVLIYIMFWSIFFLSLSQQSTRRNCSDRHILGATQVRTNCILFGVVRGMISVFEKIRDNKIVQVVFVQNLSSLRIWFNLSIFVFYTFL